MHVSPKSPPSKTNMPSRFDGPFPYGMVSNINMYAYTRFEEYYPKQSEGCGDCCATMCLKNNVNAMDIQQCFDVCKK